MSFPSVRGAFGAGNLRVVERVDNIRGTREPVFLGDTVRLNSGGPEMLVVDVDGDLITAALSNGSEGDFRRLCLSLVSSCSE